MDLSVNYRPTPDISRHEIVVVKQTFDWLHAGRELIRLHRTGEIDDATMRELERDLALEELSAISAKAWISLANFQQTNDLGQRCAELSVALQP